MQDAVVESKIDQLSIGASDEENVSQRSLTQLLISQKTALVARRFTARAARLFKSAGYTNAQRAPLRVLKTAPDGMTQAELAAKLGVHPLTISRYERGICKIPLVMAVAVQTFRLEVKA
jgi:DNA-binding XRE family transcriptional regulator